MKTSPKYTPAQALEKLKMWCARQERCHSEVRNKLYQYGLYPSEVESVIVELITQNFLNEMRFAEAYVSGKFRIKGWGRIKIKAHLRQKQVSDYCIKKALAELDETEYLNTLNNHLVKKNRLLKVSNPYERRSRLYNYAGGKGFESDLILEALDDLLK